MDPSFPKHLLFRAFALRKIVKRQVFVLFTITITTGNTAGISTSSNTSSFLLGPNIIVDTITANSRGQIMFWITAVVSSRVRAFRILEELGN